MLTFFRRQNGRAFFPALPNAARLPRRWRGAYSKRCQLGYCIAACAFSQHRKRDLILSIDFCNEKGQRDFISTLAFIASHEAPSPNGGLFYSTVRKLHQTREPRGPLPSGGKTPAKPHVPLCPCAAPPRRSGCRALALPDRRAARPVDERRQNPGQAACPSMPLHGSAAQKWVQGFSPA